MKLASYYSILLSAILASNVYAQNSKLALQSNQPGARADTSLKAHKIPSSVYKVPAILAAGGLIALTDNDILANEEFYEARNENIPDFHTDIDDYLQYAPIATVFVLDILGADAKHQFKDQALVLLKSELAMLVTVSSMKTIFGVPRPDDSANTSFPSGHTAQAFVAATFMHKEFGHKSIVYSITAYTMASAVGVMRILNNKHYASDVLVGAGIGMFMTNLMYHTHKFNRGRRGSASLNVAPIYNGRGNVGMSVLLNL